MHFANCVALVAVLFTALYHKNNLFYKSTRLIFAQNFRTN